MINKGFDYWYSWAMLYLNSNLGNLLPGITHNLQNTVHSYIMQLEMWEKKIELDKREGISDIAQAVKRLRSTTEELSSFCNQLEQRAFYLQAHPTAVYLNEFINWQKTYWLNNLFFKHYISMPVSCSENTPSILEIPPLILTIVFEEALKNAPARKGKFFQVPAVIQEEEKEE